jgi:aldose 1-epimerase
VTAGERASDRPSGQGVRSVQHDGIETLMLESAAAGGVEARFAPGAGMVGCSLLHAGEELLGQRDGLRAYAERPSTMGIPLLYPWANRLAEFEFQVAGRSITLDPDSPRLELDPNGLPIHGLMSGIPGWHVEAHEADRDRALLRASFAFDDASGLTAAFPFPHEVKIAAELRESTLSIRTAVAPTGDGPLPVSFGFHPYLRVPDVPRAEWRISVPVREHLLVDGRGLPTGDREPARIGDGPLGERTFDDGYTSLQGEPFTLAGGGREIRLTFVRGYPFAQLYAPEDDDVVAFEPMTAPTNALVSGSDLTVIEAGDSYEAAFELTVTSDS